MPTAIVTSTVTGVDNIVLVDDEDVFVAAGVTRVSTGGTALTALFDGHIIQILGTLAGETAGLKLGADVAAPTQSRLVIGETASIVGHLVGVETRGSSVSIFNDGLIQGDRGLRHVGGAGFEFINTGTIVGTGSPALEVRSNGGRIVNYGTIIGMNTGIDLTNDDSLGNVPTVDNYGKISAQGIAVWGDTSEANIIRNFGEIQGEIRGGGSDDLIFNTGLIVGDVLLGSGADRYDGRTGDVIGTVFGVAGDDTILTGTQDDVIDGGLNIDTMAGGLGDDTYVVDNAADKVIETTGGGNDQVQSTASFILAANVETLILTGGSAINGTGNASANVIIGNNFANTLNGGLGNDTLNGAISNDKLFGGAGNDRLTGGADADIFVFNTALNASTNRDTVVDFNHVADTFQLENAIFTKLGAGVHALNPAFFRAGAAAADANDYIVYNKATGVLSYDPNGNAAGGAIAFATLINKPTLAANDFQVI